MTKKNLKVSIDKVELWLFISMILVTAMIVLGGLNSKFVPITWREQDQISNVKIVKQVYQVLKILGLFSTKASAAISASYL